MKFKQSIQHRQKDITLKLKSLRPESVMSVRYIGEQVYLLWAYKIMRRSGSQAFNTSHKVV